MSATTVTISFVNAPSLITDLIRIRSPFVSHAEFILPDGRRLGAHMKGGIQARPDGYQALDTEYRCKLWVPEPDAFYAGANAKIGTPYDWKAILGLATGEDFHAPHEFICSAFVTTMLLDYNMIVPLPFKPHQVAPYDLLLICSQHADVVKCLP
jgi:hypothetical protein